MKVSPARENILKRVRNALSQPVPLPFPQAEGRQSVFDQPEGPLEIVFAKSFAASKGRFIFCSDHEEMVSNLKALAVNKQWENCYCRDISLLHQLDPFELPFLNQNSDLNAADAGLTTCEALVARTGSVVISSAQPSGRITGIFPPVHLVVAYINQLARDTEEALKMLTDKYGNDLPSMISFQSGPGRTFDIENKPVTGMHGPIEVYVFLIDQVFIL